MSKPHKDKAFLRNLRKNEGSLYIDNTTIAAAIGHSQCLIIYGNFEGYTPEEAEAKLMDTFKRLQAEQSEA